MSFPTVTDADRRLMWINFLHNCALCTVICDRDETIWQKRSRDCWIRIGSSNEYDATSIPWPVAVLKNGLA